MFTINKDKLFDILNKLNKNCKYENIINKHYYEVAKIKELVDLMDFTKYDCDYIQNRFIIIKDKHMPLEHIKNLIICPFDTELAIANTDCVNITYNFPTKKKKSYLHPETDETNESYCIKGYQNPGILNAILVYMLNTGLIQKETAIIFSLKSNHSKKDNDDIIEYFQENIHHCPHIKNVIVMDFTSLEKGYPKKDYIGKIEVESIVMAISNKIIKKAYELENFDFKQPNNYEVIVKELPKIRGGYKKLLNYFPIESYNTFRLFGFNERPVNLKYSNLLKNSFLVEWNSVEKMINLLSKIQEEGE